MVIDRPRLKDEAYRSEVLEGLFHTYRDRIFLYCVGRLGEIYGEEVAQDVFVSAWENLAKFRQDSTLETWLFGIAKKKCQQAARNVVRRRMLSKQFLEEIRASAHPEASPPLGQQTLEQARFIQLAAGLARLQNDERLLVNMRYTKGLSVAEIAELFGKTEAAVRKRLLRALRHLSELMTDDTEG